VILSIWNISNKRDDTLHRALHEQCQAASFDSSTAADDSDDQLVSSIAAEEHVSEATIRKMSALFEAPLAGDASSHGLALEEHSFRVDTTHCADPAKVPLPWPQIVTAFRDAIPEPLPDPAVEASRVAEARAATLASLLHTLDLQTRKVLNEKIKQLSSVNAHSGAESASTSSTSHLDKRQIQRCAGRWNENRRQLLSDARTEGTEAYTLLHSTHPSRQFDEGVRASSASAAAAPLDHSAALDTLLQRFQQTLTFD